MDERMKKWRKGIFERAKRLLERWKIPALLLALGAVLLLWPSGEGKTQAASSQPVSAETQTPDDEARLQALLERVEGVGRVEVMLTCAESETLVFQTDTRQGQDTREETTVFSSGASSQKTPVAVKTVKPPWRGAVVVCDGAERASVRLAVIEAVSALTGLGSDKISVIKMKRQ